MKKIITALALCAALTGCATAASINQNCFDQNDDFNDAVTCTKVTMKASPKASLSENQYFMAELFPYMDRVAHKVKKNKITYAEGKHLIDQKISELHQAIHDAIQRNMLPTLIAIMSEQSDDDSSASDTVVHHHAKIHKHPLKEKAVENKKSTASAEQ